MPDRSRYFQGGNFLKPDSKDDDGDTIVKDGMMVTVEEFSEAKTRIGTRPILRLKGIDQPFGLNATNFDKMVEKFGESEKNWAGKKIRLRVIQAPNPQNQNKMQAAIRIE